MIKVYLHHRYLSHLLLGLAFGGMLISATLRFSANLNEENETAARFSWQIQNLFLVITMVMVFWAFIYYQHHSFPFYTNLVSLWGGATVLIYMLPDFIEMEYDPLFGWNATYDPMVSLFAGPLIIFFILAFIRPIIVKIRFSQDPTVRKTGYLLIVSFSLLLFWALLSAFTIFAPIRVLRAFLLPLAWLLWAIVTWKNPLSLITTDVRMEKILIASEAGLPILFYDLEKRCTEDPTVATGILTALTSVLAEILLPRTTQDTIGFIKYQNQFVAVRHIKEGYAFFGFSSDEDPGLASAFSVFIQRFIEGYGSFLKLEGFIEPKLFLPAVELAENVFRSIYLLDGREFIPEAA